MRAQAERLQPHRVGQLDGRLLQRAVVAALEVRRFAACRTHLARLRRCASEALEELEESERASHPDGRHDVLKAMLLMAAYGIGPAQLCDALQYDLMFRWFLDMGDEDRWDEASLERGCKALLASGEAADFFRLVAARWARPI